MPNTTSPYTRADAAIAVILAVITLLLSVGLLDSDQPTGSDDFAAYMSEGIAIAKLSSGRRPECGRPDCLCLGTAADFGGRVSHRGV